MLARGRTNLCGRGAETPPASPRPTSAESAKAARKLRREELQLKAEREAEEEQRAEMLLERRKRHNSLSKSLPEGSADVTERRVKVLLKRILLCWRSPKEGTGHRPGAPTPRPDVGACLRDARQSVLGGIDTDSERE